MNEAMLGHIQFISSIKPMKLIRSHIIFRMVIFIKYLQVKLKNKSPSKVITWDGLFHVRNMHCRKIS